MEEVRKELRIYLEEDNPYGIKILINLLQGELYKSTDDEYKDILMDLIRKFNKLI